MNNSEKKNRPSIQSSKKQQNPALKKIKKQLQNIFVFYSSFGDRDNYKLLKIQNFRRMLLDSQIIANQQQCKYYDIIYYQHKTGSGLTYKSFIQIVPKIASQFYQATEYSNKQTLIKLMKQHLFVLEDFIMKKTQLGEDLAYLKHQLSSKSFQILYRVKFLLQRIYRQYWSNQNMNNNKNHEQSFIGLQVFLRQFQLCPQLISKSVAFLMYQMLIQSESEHVAEDKFNLMDHAPPGKQFTFKKFIKFLIYLSLIAHKKISQAQLNQVRKVVNLLQRMQISNGFSKIYKKIQTSQISKTTLLIGQQTILQIQGQNSSNYNSRLKNINQRSSYEYLQNSKQKYNSNVSKKQLPKLDFQQRQEQLLNKYINQLKLKFQIYCSYGDTLNTTTLKSIKISKILKQIGILTLMSQATLDLIISQLMRSSPSGKIQFTQFLKLICLVSIKTKIQLQKIIICIITHQGQHSQYAKKIQQLNQSSTIGNQHPDVYILLKQIQKSLKIYYQFYTHSKSIMNFTQFSKFMYDFQTFPFLISKPKLFQIFNQASIKFNYEKQSNSNNKNGSNKKLNKLHEKVIDFEMFKECIGACSKQIIQNKLNELQKLLLLLQRMNDSKGPKLVVKALGNTRNAYGMKTDFLSEIRKKYSYFYEKQFFKMDKKVQEYTFDSLLLNQQQQ